MDAPVDAPVNAPVNAPVDDVAAELAVLQDGPVLTHDKENLPVRDIREREAFAVARDGSPIYYRDIGPRDGGPRQSGPDGIPLVLTDGVGCDGFVWKYLVRDLAPRHRLIHWHYRGHGRTPTPRDHARCSIADLADDLASVLDDAGVDRAIVAGHSMGVQVCLETFRRHRQRVAGLVLICGSYGHPLKTFRGRATLETVLPYAAFAVRQAPRALQRAWSRLWPTRFALELSRRVEINAELLQIEDFVPYLQHMAQIEVALFLEMLAHAGKHTAFDVLPTVDVPTLIVAAEKDGFTPRYLSDEMHRSIRGSELLVVPDGSHTAPIERPDLVNAAVAQFIARIPALRSVSSVA